MILKLISFSIRKLNFQEGEIRKFRSVLSVVKKTDWYKNEIEYLIFNINTERRNLMKLSQLEELEVKNGVFCKLCQTIVSLFLSLHFNLI